MTRHSDCWMTPQCIVDAIADRFYVRFALDVCATDESAKAPRWITEADDGLSVDWLSMVGNQQESGERPAIWCNPPYSSPGPWIDRCIEAGRSVDVFALVPWSLAGWARKAMLSATWVYCPTARIRFIWPPWLPARDRSSDGARQDTCIVRWSPGGATNDRGVIFASEADWLPVKTFDPNRWRFDHPRAGRSGRGTP